MSSLERSVRSLTFTFQRTVKADAPEASHSFGSQPKSMPPRRSRSSTAAKSVAVNCGSISLKTALGPRVSSAISDHRPIATTTVEVMAEAATTEAAAAAGTLARSTGRRSPKAVAEAYAARSEASSNVKLAASCVARALGTAYTTGLKFSGEV